MATSKPPYDPMKTVEAMFNGSVTRIAYVMRDPLNYAQQTKAVLAETAKKFQDALDDCEIQILDAKWYLEHQLALNKARREAKAKEDTVASAKRKRDEVQDVQDKAQTAEGENAPKRVRTQEPEESEEPAVPQQKPQEKSPAQKPAPQPAAAPNKIGTQTAPIIKDKPEIAKPPEQPKVSVVSDVKSVQPAVPPAPRAQERPKPPEPVHVPERTMTQTTTDELPRQTPLDTPADGNEAFNFESMFGEPSAEMMDEPGDDMTFDLDNLGGDGYGGDGSLQDNSLNSLLPGLESYANQAGDDANFGMQTQLTNGLLNGTDTGTISNSFVDPMNSQPLIQPTNALPALEPNEFDDFLNSNNIEFDENMNLEGEAMMDMNMENMDFDSMFS